MQKKFYAIRNGRKSGIVVTSWPECKKLVDGFKGAIYKGFASHQKTEADRFAKSGFYSKSVRTKTSNPSWDNDKYPCIERKTYHDTLTGVLYKNRCIRREGPTVRGDLYKPHIGNSLPW